MYEASQHTIITRKPVFPSSAGGLRTVSTVGPSSPQNCQTGVEEQAKKEMVKDGSQRKMGGSGSLTPVELTPPPSATTTRPAASLSKYFILDFTFPLYGRILTTLSCKYPPNLPTPRPVLLEANIEREVTVLA